MGSSLVGVFFDDGFSFSGAFALSETFSGTASSFLSSFSTPVFSDASFFCFICFPEPSLVFPGLFFSEISPVFSSNLKKTYFHLLFSFVLCQLQLASSFLIPRTARGWTISRNAPLCTVCLVVDDWGRQSPVELRCCPFLAVFSSDLRNSPRHGIQTAKTPKTESGTKSGESGADLIQTLAGILE